jgi:hypothetical protein
LLKESYRLRSQIKLRQLEDQISLYESQIRAADTDGALFSAKEKRDETLSELNIVRSQLGLKPIESDTRDDAYKRKSISTLHTSDNTKSSIYSETIHLESTVSLEDYETRLRLFEAKLLDEKESLDRREAVINSLLLKIQQEEKEKKNEREEEYHLLEDKKQDIRVSLTFDASPREKNANTTIHTYTHSTSSNEQLLLINQALQSSTPKISVLEAAAAAAANQASYSSAKALINETITACAPSTIPERAILWDLIVTTMTPKTIVNSSTSSSSSSSSPYLQKNMNDKSKIKSEILATEKTTEMITNGNKAIDIVTHSPKYQGISLSSDSIQGKQQQQQQQQQQQFHQQQQQHQLAVPNSFQTSTSIVQLPGPSLFSQTSSGLNTAKHIDIETKNREIIPSKSISTTTPSSSSTSSSSTSSSSTSSSSTSSSSTSSSSTSLTSIPFIPYSLVPAPLSPSLSKPMRPRSQPIQSWGT